MTRSNVGQDLTNVLMRLYRERLFENTTRFEKRRTSTKNATELVERRRRVGTVSADRIAEVDLRLVHGSHSKKRSTQHDQRPIANAFTGSRLAIQRFSVIVMALLEFD